ncbi:helix-turn-helix domain-containing protein [Methylobacterium nodulans]|uniref:Putative transcription regulator with HTH domain protein n=1 Tax=Methylobacterium nodulans (strain LMG 21967 / CNCM I-2342 / ORS 2060) TaxID=460265 RepID=B8ILU0_METNO|nr:helix-turn-helix domain-containing protein [Methylobacterium nodulans]ACL62065.1 putative transcription regulator with HTH domain protein [Methylobacterium nodulans ORS 2060]
MDIRPIRNDTDHAEALKEIERLWGAPLGTPEGDKLDVLATLVEAYENEHHPVEAADPVEILRFAIEDMGRSQAELAELLGSRSRASEILNRKRHLTLDQIRAISEAWKLPIAALAAPYRLAQDAA